MSCDRCDNAAVIHVTEPADGRNVERHFCEDRALKEGIAAVTIPPDTPAGEEQRIIAGGRITPRNFTVIWKTKGAGD